MPNISLDTCLIVTRELIDLLDCYNHVVRVRAISLGQDGEDYPTVCYIPSLNSMHQWCRLGKLFLSLKTLLILN